MDEPKRSLLDELLTLGAKALDVSPTQYEDAVRKYEAVGSWLSRDGTMLAHVDPQIYPQGSIAIGTATRPVGKEEFDLDLVCELNVSDDTTPAALKRALGARLRESDVYRTRIEEKNRCWRIVYAGDFHLDVLPAKPDRRFPTPSALRIPDRRLAAWKESDPKGYAAWFGQQSKRSISEIGAIRADVAAPPPHPSDGVKSPLQLSVQLLKRHRDIYFAGDDDAPISIIITTLAAKAYRGHASVYDTLSRLLADMPHHVQHDVHGRAVVANPVNSLENFADKWAEEPRKAECFNRWIDQASADLMAVSRASLPEMTRPLTNFVGDRVAKRVLSDYGRRTHQMRGSGLKVDPRSGLVGALTPAAVAAPRHTFYGR